MIDIFQCIFVQVRVAPQNNQPIQVVLFGVIFSGRPKIPRRCIYFTCVPQDPTDVWLGYTWRAADAFLSHHAVTSKNVKGPCSLSGLTLSDPSRTVVLMLPASVAVATKMAIALFQGQPARRRGKDPRNTLLFLCGQQTTTGHSAIAPTQCSSLPLVHLQPSLIARGNAWPARFALHRNCSNYTGH